MTGIHFSAPSLLFLLWTIPAVIGFYLYAARMRRKSLRRFAGQPTLPLLTLEVDLRKRAWKSSLVATALFFMVLAAARPGWNPRPETVRRTGRDVVFAVDVSRSMLAEDIKPSRIQRAKYAILDTVNRLAGDRVALVAFAGQAVVTCPLTHDYGFFRDAVQRLHPGAVSRAGTLIGDAVRTAADDVFDRAGKRYKDIVLITDGEDHDSYPVEAAKLVGSRGIRLIVVGLGDEKRGTPIPITRPDGSRTWLTYKGKKVLSRLDGDTLRAMAAATPGGRYFNVATGTIDLAEIYLHVIRSAEQTRLTSQTFIRYQEKFQIFLLVALLLLAVEPLITLRRRNHS